MLARALCLAVLLFPLACAWPQSSCSPPALGHPCALGGVASQGSHEPGLNLGIGNPINLASGNKYQQELDLPAHPSAPLLQVLRHYNSLDPRHGAFGRGWSTSYDTRLHRAAGRIQIVQADGSRIDLGNGADWPLRSRHGVLQPVGKQWLWRWPDGRQLRFDQQGRLLRIAAPQNINIPPARKTPSTRTASGTQATKRLASEAYAVVDIVRHHQAGPLDGAIDRVIASQGQEPHFVLQFHYRIDAGHAHVSAIDTPQGRLVYRYEQARTGGAPSPWLRLTAMLRPDGYERRYLYDAAQQAGHPGLVTGMALAAPDGTVLPLHSWAYDIHGRAIASTLHHPKAQAYALRIDYAQPANTHQNGLTLVDHADGRRTRFEFSLLAGQHKLLNVQGAPCPGCAAPGSLGKYESNGRIKQLNGTQFTHHVSGRLQRLHPDAPGWPGLQLDFDASGRRSAWYSLATGKDQTAFDESGRPVRRVFANGDEWRYRYDTQGRPIQIITKNQHAALLTRLSWRKAQLAAIRHPHENEFRRYDSLGRLSERRLQRPLFSEQGSRLEYVDRFDYDQHHLVATHHLPEGGALLFERDAHGRLMRLIWRDAEGLEHEVIQAWPDQPGYRYGNGLGLALHFQQGNAMALTLYDEDRIIWDHFRSPDALNRPTRESDHVASHGFTRDWHYAYDHASRLAIAAVEPAARAPTQRRQTPGQYWHAWQPDGEAAAVKHNARNLTPKIKRDAAGLPLSAEGYDLRYSPQRRLEQVSRQGKVLDQYRHNAFGHRIQASTPDEQAQYFYLDNRLVAEARHSRHPNTRPQNRLITRRYLYAGHALVGLIDYSNDAPAGTLYAVHTDLMGAPRLVTDTTRQIRWLAQYTPFGAAQRIKGDLTLNLRLPGQIADATTGWHDNLMRTYDPRFGHYLEPDPLGPLPGSQALGYAAQQPRRFIDPLGLLLFAFDGTRQNTHTRSNVWLLSQRYQDGPVFYHSGPGNPYYLDLDTLVAHTAAQTIQTQWQHLLNALHGAIPRAEQPIPIDIIGYSRGAALARHFGNLVEQHVDQGLFSYADPLRGQISTCVDLRFMGLFDTVAQFGLNGQLNDTYDFSIAAAWGWVAHAVALHERRPLFPLLAATEGLTDNVIEAPFVGAHADIGGGIPAGKQDAHIHGDLSDVALNWMLWQANAAAVPMAKLPTEQTSVDQPILHDARASLARSIQDSDRRVDGPDGRKQLNYQDDHHRYGRRQREATEALIDRYENWRRNDTDAVGTVDLDAYARWLYDELGWQAAPLQATSMENQAII